MNNLEQAIDHCFSQGAAILGNPYALSAFFSLRDQLEAGTLRAAELRLLRLCRHRGAMRKVYHRKRRLTSMPNLACEIDWTGCDLVEQVPGKVSGQPIVRGTRILPGPVVRSFDRGEPIEQIREDWPSLSVAQIKALVAFAHVQTGQPLP